MFLRVRSVLEQSGDKGVRDDLRASGLASTI